MCVLGEEVGRPSYSHLHIAFLKMGLPWWLRAVKKSTCNAEDPGLIPGSGRSPGGGSGVATHSSILAWRIAAREELDGLQSTGLQRVRHD